MLPTEAATPSELRQEARYAQQEQRTMARADAASVQTYRCCACGTTHSARYVAWNGRECYDGCGGRLEPMVKLRNPVTGDMTVPLRSGPPLG